MRNVKHQKISVFHSGNHIWVSHKVLRQLDAWEVLDVLVLRVDDFSQLSALNLFFEHPHVDLLLEEVRLFSSVLGHKLGHGGTPVTGTDDTDSERLWDRVWSSHD